MTKLFITTGEGLFFLDTERGRTEQLTDKPCFGICRGNDLYDYFMVEWQGNKSFLFHFQLVGYNHLEYGKQMLHLPESVHGIGLGGSSLYVCDTINSRLLRFGPLPSLEDDGHELPAGKVIERGQAGYLHLNSVYVAGSGRVYTLAHMNTGQSRLYYMSRENNWNWNKDERELGEGCHDIGPALYYTCSGEASVKCLATERWIYTFHDEEKPFVRGLATAYEDAGPPEQTYEAVFVGLSRWEPNRGKRRDPGFSDVAHLIIPDEGGIGVYEKNRYRIPSSQIHAICRIK